MFLWYISLFIYFSGIFLAHANFTRVVSNINDITTDTIDEAIANEDLDNVILNAIKSIRNIKKRPDCSVIYDYLSKLLPNSEIYEKNILNRLEYLANNSTLKYTPTSLQMKLTKICRIFLMSKFHVP